ncbi:FAS1-like dehydratase domain-containing protein [Elioraea thermophila]|uniref:FAS1-like dehydratase domain-containing protein n=1 Tax=Elioraea thermophila TaxID=2185104 RepID=UPI000DF4BEE3|nr:MaoC family dehydratase N-terminal domain-containing protein [Elioraea thermophila]
MGEAWQAWLGRTVTLEDEVDPRRPAWLAATLGVSLAEAAPGGALPPLWHWILFQDWRPPASLGSDGHPKRGGFLPPVHHLPRRMWAGGRLAFPGTLRIGDRVRRTSTITAITEKHGASGPLVFVTVRHVIDGPSGCVIEEEQDIVYRDGSGPARKEAPPEPVPEGAAIAEIVPDPVLLFRYSALTGNGHRIHYDADYVREVEGYPGLVVHGPLQATWLAGLAARLRPQRRLARFSFRGLRPAFVGERLRLVGAESGDRVALSVRDPSGAVTLAAEATFA